MVLFVFLFYSVCNFGKFIKFGLGTVRSESVTLSHNSFLFSLDVLNRLSPHSFVSSVQAIRRTIDKKTVEVYQLFNEELNLVKKEFNTKTVDMPPMYPHYAGSAAWARMLKRRIDRPMGVR